MKVDWARIARRGAEAPRPHRPRYTEAEARRLWAHLDGADPRLRLAVEIGAPGPRIVQVARARRSDLKLELGVGVHGLGRMRIPGARGKPGVMIDLDPAARRAVDHALTGLLAEREAAYRAGRIEDYAVVPGGRLREGTAPIGREPLRPLSLTTLSELHQAWEQSAEVPHCGLRALRRLGVDLAAQERAGTDSPDAQDHLGGWVVGSGTRQRVYRDAEDARAREEAERLRARIRARLRASSTPTAPRQRVPAGRAG